MGRRLKIEFWNLNEIVGAQISTQIPYTPCYATLGRVLYKPPARAQRNLWNCIFDSRILRVENHIMAMQA